MVLCGEEPHAFLDIRLRSWVIDVMDAMDSMMTVSNPVDSDHDLDPRVSGGTPWPSQENPPGRARSGSLKRPGLGELVGNDQCELLVCTIRGTLYLFYFTFLSFSCLAFVHCSFVLLKN